MFGRDKSLDAEVQRGVEVQAMMHKVMALIETGDKASARSKLDQMLEYSPADGMVRLFAMTVFRQMGDNEAALTQLAIGLALCPDYYALHGHFARILLQQGKRMDAERVLEAGWQYAKKHSSKERLAEERANFFAVLSKSSSSDGNS